MSPFSPTNDSTTLSAIDSQSNGIRVAFEWRADRFYHAIYGVNQGEPILLAESVEGDAVNPWPPSPPLQQLHKQQNESGEILFLTGMAGSSHWSGSVSTTIGESGPEVAFDFACRHRMEPEWLGVTYRLASGVEAEAIGDGVRVKVGEAMEWRIGSENVSLSDDVLTIAAKWNTQVDTANTSRWAYVVRLID